MSTDVENTTEVQTQTGASGDTALLPTPHVLRFKRSSAARSQRSLVMELYTPSEESPLALHSSDPGSVRTPSSATCSAASSATGAAPSAPDCDSTGSPCLTAAGGQLPWCPSETSGSPCLCHADVVHLPLGCDVADAVSAMLRLGPAPAADGSTPCQPAGSPAGLPLDQAMLSVGPALAPAAAPLMLHAAVLTPSLSDPLSFVSPLLGSEVLSEAEIPLQDEHVIADDDAGGPDLPEDLFPSPGSSWRSGSSQPGNDSGNENSIQQTSDLSLTADLDQLLCCDAPVGDYQVASGYRCYFSKAYDKQSVHSNLLNVQILPADPSEAVHRSGVWPSEERGVPESKASVAIQRLISSVVPPISADLVRPELCLDGDSATLADRVVCPATLDDAPVSATAGPAAPSDPLRRAPPAEDAGRLADCDVLFTPCAGRAEDDLDAFTLSEESVVFLNEIDMMDTSEVEVPPEEADPVSAGGRRGRRGRGRRPAAGRGRWTVRREVEHSGVGRRGRRRGRGRRPGRAAVVPGDPPDGCSETDRGGQRRRGQPRSSVFVTGRGHPDSWAGREAAPCPASLDSPPPADGAGDAEPAVPCRHFRKVVVGLADLGPEPLAPTQKYDLWRRLSGMAVMHDLCHCLDLSYSVVTAADGRAGYRCNICRKEFALHSSVRRHHRMVHDDERRYSCAECGANYFQLSDLKRHLLASHTQLKPFACELCGDRFSRPAEYRKHANMHWRGGFVR